MYLLNLENDFMSKTSQRTDKDKKQTQLKAIGEISRRAAKEEMEKSIKLGEEAREYLTGPDSSDEEHMQLIRARRDGVYLAGDDSSDEEMTPERTPSPEVAVKSDRRTRVLQLAKRYYDNSNDRG